MGHSPPGSSVHEVSQARILELVAIYFSQPFLPHPKPHPHPQAIPKCLRAKLFHSCPALCNPMDYSPLAPLSMGFSYWSGLPCPPPGDLPDPGTKHTSLMSPALAGGFFTTSATWEALLKPDPALSLEPAPSLTYRERQSQCHLPSYLQLHPHSIPPQPHPSLSFIPTQLQPYPTIPFPSPSLPQTPRWQPFRWCIYLIFPSSHSQSDSGGPLVCDETLQGILSWGVYPCGSAQHPAVYTQICKYRSWIEKTIRSN